MMCLARHGLIPLVWWKSVRNRIDDYLRVDDSIDSVAWESPLGMSDFSRRLLLRVDLAAIVEKRRENYRFWMEKLKDFAGTEPLFPDLTIGQVPFSFPVLVDNRDAIVRAVARRGVYLEPTLAAPYRRISTLVNGDEDFSEIEAISARMLSLPVHQSLTFDNLKWVWKIFREAIEATILNQKR
jgi:dTDP-4-amino-4,6-dideoxygalactose transaminase